MSELQNKFQSIMKKIEGKIQDEEELKFIKEQIADMSVLFLDQLDKVVELSESRMNKVIEKEKQLETKLNEVEASVKNMEREFFVDDNYDFEIVCPYCNYEFVSDFSQSVKEEVECPECHNIIELDWNNEEEHECSGHCLCCQEDCGEDYEEQSEEQDENEKEQQDNDDDM